MKKSRERKWECVEETISSSFVVTSLSFFLTSSSCASTRAPLLSKSLTISTCPSLAAKWSGVKPDCKRERERERDVKKWTETEMMEWKIKTCLSDERHVVGGKWTKSNGRNEAEKEIGRKERRKKWEGKKEGNKKMEWGGNTSHVHVWSNYAPDFKSHHSQHFGISHLRDRKNEKEWNDVE